MLSIVRKARVHGRTRAKETKVSRVSNTFMITTSDRQQIVSFTFPYGASEAPEDILSVLVGGAACDRPVPWLAANRLLRLDHVGAVTGQPSSM